MPSSTAWSTLQKARFFNHQASLAGKENVESFIRYIEASIIFGRSVTFHIRKEFGKTQGFAEWYKPKQEEMGSNETCKFLLEKRNVILKEGPVEIAQTTSLDLSITVRPVGYGRAELIHPNPWYRRSPRILLKSVLMYISRPFKKLVRDRGRPEAQQRGGKSSTAEVTVSLRFEEDGFGNRPATEVVSEYLDYLEGIVIEAEKAFSYSE